MDLRWYQQEAVEAAYHHLCNEAGNPVVCLPTGAGKSIVIAELARRAVEDYSGRVLILQHRKELIQQNADKVRRLLSIPVGEYSAGLRRYATEEDVVLCGIQSVYSKATLFDRRHLIIIDEVHLVPSDGEGMYQTFLNDMRTINQQVRCVGLTATPFRTGEGPICRANGVFHNLCYNADVKRLIDEGFLSKVTNRPSATHFDTSKLHMRYGEFITKELEQLFGGSQVAEACKEIVEKTADRKSIMVFCTSLMHAGSVASTLEQLTGESIAVVEGGTLPLERAAILDRFKNRQVRWLINVDVLTTGFDAPCVDAIAILRATASPGLFAQIVGRGLRMHPGKDDCLVLDFGENVKRHGSIDSTEYGKPKGEARGKSKTPVSPEDGKLCPNCDVIIPKKQRLCECGFQFPHREPNHENEADIHSQILSNGEPPEPPEVFEITGATATRHQKEGKLPSLRISYGVDESMNMPWGLSEWVCIEHAGFARKKAEAWWKEHCSLPCPDTIDEAIDLFYRGWIAIPRNVTTVKDGKYRRFIAREIDELPIGLAEGEVLEEAPF
jgi:DNA repair protein RadD